MIKFRIPFRLPSLNDYIDICRKNKYSASVHKKQIENDIMWFLPNERISGAVRMRFIWHEKNMRRDKDNVAFAKKYILDALQKKGVLPDDGNKYVLGFADDFIYGEADGAEVILTEGGDS